MIFFSESIHQIVHDYGYLAVSLGILLEDFGLPTPGETLLISGAVAASQGALDIKLLLFLAWISAVVGDNIGYLIGRYGGNRVIVRYGSRIGITAPRLKKVEGFFDRHGDVVIIFARFVVLARQLNGIVAGTLEMHWARFLLFNAIGAALWVGFWGLLAYFLGKSIFHYVHDYIHEIRHVEPLLIGLAILAALGIALYGFLWHRRRQRRDQAEAAERR